MSDVLAVRGLGKRYNGFELRDVSFSVPRGYVTGLIGPNGAGKTTTLKLILGLLHRDAGEIDVFGLDPRSAGAEIRSRIGFVHDEPRFYRHLTLARNASLVAGCYPRWDQKLFSGLASEFGLRLGQRFGTVSRGTRTRFALALAMAHGAELILMDEPTSGLDPVFRRELLDRLAGLLRDGRASILFSTHITADLDRIADYVTLLQHGRVVISTEKDELLERWRLVKGGPELLERLPRGALRGLRRGPHGFEGLTDEPDLVRGCVGEDVLLERPTLEDVVFLTARGVADA